MQEIRTIMRATELQRLIEDKVSEWRERSARVAGGSVADSYQQQPVKFRRHTNRRKNSAEINKIITKYSKPNKRADERHTAVMRDTSNLNNNRITYPSSQYHSRNNAVYNAQESPPIRPERTKKLRKLSQSADNLTTLDMNNESKGHSLNRFSDTEYKYNAKSYEDITAFADVHYVNKSKNFEYKNILTNKSVNNVALKDNTIREDILDRTDFDEFEIRRKSDFVTSTPKARRKSHYDEILTIDEREFEKCSTSSSVSVSELKKGKSEPDIISAVNHDPSNTTKTLDFRQKWKKLKQPFRKGKFVRLLPWKGRRSRTELTR